MNQEKIGKFIAKCRKDKNITQEQLAEKLGVSNKSISRWENGRNMPDYSILKELCNTLDIDVNEFLIGFIFSIFILLVALFALVSTTTTVSAQFYNRKKVAITEVVDKSGDVAPGTKTFIRSALTDAITNSDGYEGYASISFLSLEMNFDKTGNISSASLTYVKKQMMEYILVSEVTPLDKKTVLLSARIVNTSNGKIVASSSVRTYADIDYLRSACNSLAFKLVGAI